MLGATGAGGEVNCAKCGQPLEAGNLYCGRCGAPNVPLAAAPPPITLPGQAGEVLEGKWKLERKIGEGGMGSVYLAHDLQLDRKVAIKMLAPALCHDAELVTRFEREAKLTAGLEHPNIVPIYAVGRAGPRPFMVMKYLEGTALSMHLRHKGTLGRDELLPLIRQVAAGLDFIHARGFVHRDIKTGNIFVGPNGEGTILDFGILRPSRNAEALTRTGMVMGTPQYMSPEQALGIRDIDHRADLYALAVVIFECITGRLPFEADSDLMVIQMQAHSPPPDIRTRSPWVPPEVAEVMIRALSKRLEERYPSATELVTALGKAFGVQLLTGPQLPTAASSSFPIALEPTPPTPGELMARVQPSPPAPPLPAPMDDRTRPSRPSGMAAAKLAAEPAREKAPEQAPRRSGARIALPLAALAVLAAGGAVALKVSGAPEAALDAGAELATSALPDASLAQAEPPPAEPAASAADASTEPVDEPVELASLAAPEGADAGAGAPAASTPAHLHSKRPQKGSGQVNVLTTYRGGPFWAAITVDGERRGTTPALLELSAGKHQLRLERAGFRPISKQIKVAPGASAVLRIELVP